MSEKRKTDRENESMEVIVTARGFKPMTRKTGNFCEDGVYLNSDGHILPDVGVQIVVTLSEFLGSTEPMAMVATVVHKDDLGMGIEFQGIAE